MNNKLLAFILALSFVAIFWLAQKPSAYDRKIQEIEARNVAKLDSLAKLAASYKIKILELQTKVNVMEEERALKIAENRRLRKNYDSLKNLPPKVYTRDAEIDSILATMYPR